MSARFTLLRHCQSTWNLERRCQGDVVEPALTPLGLRQARGAARRMRRLGFQIVYSSDQLRAYQTALIVAAAAHIRTVLVDSRLREMYQGDWQGMLYSDIEQQYGDRYSAFLADPTMTPSPGGETVQQLAQRAVEAMNDLAHRYPDKHVLVVSHEFPLAALRCISRGKLLNEVFEDPPRNGEAFSLDWPPPAHAVELAENQNVDVFASRSGRGLFAESHS